MTPERVTVNFQLIRHREAEPLFDPAVAAALAGITRQALEAYRRAELVQPKMRGDGSWGYSVTDIRRLIRIRRLRSEVDLDLEAVEVVLHLRAQVRDLQREVEMLRQRHALREQELLQVIQQLRRELATEPRWRQVAGTSR